MERENTLSQILLKKKSETKESLWLSVSHMSVIHLIEFSSEAFFLQ